MVAEKHWEYTADHTFYRYDKLCGGVGKFSTKLVKVFAYQKTDHVAWAKEQDEIRIQEEFKRKVLAEEQAKKDAERKAKEDAKEARKNKGKKKGMA